MRCLPEEGNPQNTHERSQEPSQPNVCESRGSNRAWRRRRTLENRAEERRDSGGLGRNETIVRRVVGQRIFDIKCYAGQRSVGRLFFFFFGFGVFYNQ